MQLAKFKFICPKLILLLVCLCFLNVTVAGVCAKQLEIKKPLVDNTQGKQVVKISRVVIKEVPMMTTASGEPFIPLSEAIGPKDSALLVAPDGGQLYAKNVDLGLVPASTIKVLTVANAIHYLGNDYRFRTEIYLTPEKSLKIKGCGDPMLSAKIVKQLIEELVPRLPYKKFRNLELDDTFFAGGTFIVDGVENNLTKLYNAANGALSVNFNVVQFDTDKNGKLVNTDPDTPMVPLSLARAAATGQKKGNFVLWHENFEPTMYAGEIFKYYLEENGVQFSGELVRKPVTSKDLLLLEFQSPYTLSEVSRSLLRYSNNFIANQIMMTVAAEITGEPATLQQGIMLTQQYLNNNLKLNNVKLVEASGLSRMNNICASDMYTILQNFESCKDLLRNENGHLFKTGTLSDVRSRVGFIETPKGSYSFVIMMNTPGRSAMPVLDNFFELVSQDAGLYEESQANIN